ncbi:hotdog fold thioesterase [Pseudooceanicola sp. 216_PA32_1]|uniref:Hotdog fold thioesterase n=1 Tax=Pseudooceanicola pacificus TaxID=2676438 RepID=A0A844WB37_9RHOB|nr:PaaI family thioesterase [Pseudooceanicola pacificus]MWB76440.1 hotdog fold thioesterase [Pseudooceanicola pacificus]
MKDAQLDPQLIEDPYPFQKHMGFYLADWREDYARFELPVEDFLTNRYGILHGGVMSVMADTVMGFAGCYTGDPDNRKLGMTLNLNVNYLGQIQGKLMIAEGFRTGGGRKSFFGEAKISDELGTRVATATGVFRYRQAG